MSRFLSLLKPPLPWWEGIEERGRFSLIFSLLKKFSSF
jgi:hypothetical protein